jgi:membrane-bound lytic murein transglycosylase MltF
LIGVVLLTTSLSSEPALAQQSSDEQALLSHANDPWNGDLDGMFERGFVRVLTSYNPIYFTYDGMEQRGLGVDAAHALEKYLNEHYGRKDRRLQLLLVPVSRDELLQRLGAGKGDIAAANLTITTQRQNLVNFSDPLYPGVSELVVTGPAAPGISSFDDLASTEVHVRKSSSYFEHLTAFNASRKQRNGDVIRIREADERLEDHDLLEMVNAGIIPAVIVDSHKAALWEQVFEDIEVHRDMAVHPGLSIAWAVRKGAPKLTEAVNGFVKTARKGTLLGNILIKRYLTNTDWIDNVRDEDSQKRYEDTVDIIKRYAERYDFDWLMIAAQGYQESRLDQRKRSPAGAVGIMQILPSTAADPNVDIRDIHDPDQNVHAGVKYLRFIRERYFSAPEIGPLDQVLFSLAAYNAGPANINQARSNAAEMGFDANRWFGHVEVAVSRTISREPVIYVRNIYKYYVAYRHMERIRQERETILGGDSRAAPGADPTNMNAGPPGATRPGA